MFTKLFLVFAILPIIEIAILVNVGEVIGGWNTVGLVIITAFIGAWLVRKEGLATLLTAQRRMKSGELPGQQMAEGLLLVIAGVLLVTPGFVTDGVGFLLSMPLTRPYLARYLLKHMQVSVLHGSEQFRQPHGEGHWQQNTAARESDHTVIEGEYEDKSGTSRANHLSDDGSSGGKQ